MRIEQATINLKVAAQGWNVRLSCLADSTSRLIVEQSDWSNESSFQMDRRDGLKLDRAGGIVIGLEVAPVSDRDNTDPLVPWKIEFVRMQLVGQMPE